MGCKVKAEKGHYSAAFEDGDVSAVQPSDSTMRYAPVRHVGADIWYMKRVLCQEIKGHSLNHFSDYTLNILLT